MEQKEFDKGIREFLETDVMTYFANNLFSSYNANVDAFVKRRLELYGLSMDDLPFTTMEQISKLYEILLDMKMIDPEWGVEDQSIRCLVYIDLLIHNIAGLYGIICQEDLENIPFLKKISDEIPVHILNR